MFQYNSSSIKTDCSSVRNTAMIFLVPDFVSTELNSISTIAEFFASSLDWLILMLESFQLNYNEKLPMPPYNGFVEP